ncbi:MAG: DUF3108 domain-containing protein [Polyangia bacterium]
MNTPRSSLRSLARAALWALGAAALAVGSSAAAPKLASAEPATMPGASGQAAAPAPAPRPAPSNRQGEAYTFSLRFLGSVDAGRARLAIAPPQKRGADTVIHVVGEGEAVGFAKALTGLHEDYRLVLDAGTLLPRHMQFNETGMRTRTATLTMTGKKIDITVKRPDSERRVIATMPSEPVEPVAVLLMLRAARLKDGDKLDLTFIDGAAFYQGTIEVVGREEIRTAIGARAAIKLACRGERINEFGQKVPNRPVRQGTVWVSDDAERLPLRIEGESELGRAEFALTSYDLGRRPLPLPKKLVGVTEHQAAD